MIRTCLGCRARAEKANLVRVVAKRGSARWKVEPDFAYTQPGRGAYLHPTAECIERSIARRSFHRALRISGQVETDELHRIVERATR